MNTAIPKDRFPSARRILIVDDDRDFAEGMAEILEIEGHRVKVLYDGEAAIEIFCDEDYDITFMDVRLPGKNGVESFFAIRDLKPDARVVMMTAYWSDKLLQEALSGGAWKVLHKPLDMDAVLNIIQEGETEKCMVLVADDDADFAEGVREVLEREGYRARVASNGQQALDELDACRADVLILDLRMPIMGGIETIMQMNRKKCLIPTILVTAYSAEESDSISKINHLTCGLLKKPFDPGRLIEAIEKVNGDP